MKKRWLLSLAILSLFVGMFAFWGADAQQIAALANGIVAVAAIVFGILGVWMSVLHPANELDTEESSQPDRKTDLALELASALEQATYILAFATLYRLSLAVIPLAGDRLSSLVNVEYSVLLQNALVGVSGSVVVFLYLFEALILVVSALPILSMRRTREQIEFRRKEAEGPPNGVD